MILANLGGLLVGFEMLSDHFAKRRIPDLPPAILPNDWRGPPLVALAVGFGGSMVWFGSSAGVAIATQFPQAKSVFAWIRCGRFIPPAYPAGFAAFIILIGWSSEGG